MAIGGHRHAVSPGTRNRRLWVSVDGLNDDPAIFRNANGHIRDLVGGRRAARDELGFQKPVKRGERRGLSYRREVPAGPWCAPRRRRRRTITQALDAARSA